jgi:hypothetical protein
MAKKGYWQTKKGKSAIQQQGAIDAAGAMRVTPATQNSLGSVDVGMVRAPNMGINPGSLSGRGTMQTFDNKLITQGPTTGFGSFRGGTSISGVERKATVRSPVAPDYRIRDYDVI